MIKSIIAKYLFEPAYYGVYGRFNWLKYYSFLKRTQWDTLEENKKTQAGLLYELLDYSSKNIPYYKRIFEKKNIKIDKSTIFEDIRKIPVMTKEIIRSEFNNMYNIRKGISWHYTSSGGSTGEPIKLIQDNEFKMKMMLIKNIQKEWAGYQLGETEIMLWGSEKDIIEKKESIMHRFANWIKSSYVLNSFMMDPLKMKGYIGIINKKKPRLILSYAQSINELAKFIEEEKLEVFSPHAIMTSAGILYPQFRENIEKAFKCPVFNRYGSREVWDAACECEKHEGLHVMMLTHYVEILNSKLQPCKEGEVGYVYITLLTNFTMPLIRYKIGDMAQYTEKMCSCGRGLPLIKEIAGRDMDVFKTKDGRLIQGEFFIHFIGVVYNTGIIDKFQVIQKDYDLLEIKVVVKDRDGFERNKGKIEKSIRKVMGNKCRIRWNLVNDIKPTKSGKYRYTIREF